MRVTVGDLLKVLKDEAPDQPLLFEVSDKDKRLFGVELTINPKSHAIHRGVSRVVLFFTEEVCSEN